MFYIQNTASEYYGMQKGFLTAYQNNVIHFLTQMMEVGYENDSSDFASLVLELRRHTIVTFHELQIFKNQICTNLLEVYPWQLKEWVGKFYQLICIQLQGTLHYSIKSLVRKHPELFNFTSRKVCQHATRLLENPSLVNNMDLGPMNICVLFVMNKRLFNLLRSCLRELEQRTDDDLLRIYNQRWEDYKKQKSFKSINLLIRSYNRLTENGRLSKAQYNILSDSIFNEIEDKELRGAVEGYIGNPVGLIKELQELGHQDSIMEQVFCAYTKLEELDRLNELREKPEPLNYNQKLIAFLTACVQDVQAGSYSKDGEKLIRNSNEWFYVYRIFVEKNIVGLLQCKEFVNNLKEVNIKVDKLPTSPQSLYKTGQEFKDRFYPNWARPHGNKASKFERFLEIGAETLKSCDKHIHLLS